MSMRANESRERAERIDCECRGDVCGGIGCGKPKDTDHVKHYKCTGCDRWVPWSFGGAPDPQCDDCWARKPENAEHVAPVGMSP